MCGIAGILSPLQQPVNTLYAQKMIAALAHRGPDGEAMWHNDAQTVLLAHRRLSIIDLSAAGVQPMHYAGRYTIVHNGELYNYIELKNFLQIKGYKFNSATDTEVIAAAYNFWGTNCLQQFEGMFAFAIWDEAEQQLFAARDRFGEKPFYYYEDSSLFAFASEMKALWAAGIEKKADDKMLLNYLTLGHVQNSADKEQTFFKDIWQLAPAHYLIYKPQEQKLITKQYWRLNSDVRTKVSAADAIENFNVLFTASVKKRLRSDVAVGASLSGGIDSSTIAAVVKSITGQPMPVFSAVFPGFEKDESQYSKTVADFLSVPQFTITPNAEALVADFEKLCYHQEEPFGSSSIYAQYNVFALAQQQQIKVLLDGQGADETLAGYHRYIHWFLQDLLSHYKPGAMQKESAALVRNNVKFKWGIKDYIAAFMPMHAAMQLERMEYMATIHHQDITPAFVKKQRGREWEGIHKPVVTKLNDILHFNCVEMGLEEMLRYADRSSMAHGVEVRLPFLDHTLVEFLFSLPATMKIHEGWTKWLLRKAMDKKLPDSIVWRKDKIGYEPPQQDWMQHTVMQDYLQEAKRKLVNKQILNEAVLNKPATAQDAHEKNNYDWRYLCAAQIV
jgi:asparagine synthase (glutamine-hydrolysing)